MKTETKTVIKEDFKSQLAYLSTQANVNGSYKSFKYGMITKKDIKIGKANIGVSFIIIIVFSFVSIVTFIIQKNIVALKSFLST